MIDHATGVGVNLTPEFYGDVMIERPVEYDFLEVDPNVFDLNHAVRETFRQVSDRYPIVLHSTTLSICGDVPFAVDELRHVADFATLVGSHVYSDHLSFTGAGELKLDLYMTPLFTDEMIEWVRTRVAAVTAATGLPFVLENVGMIVGQPDSPYSEMDFLRQIGTHTEARLQLNLDSVAVSAATLGLDPVEYVREFPFDLVETVAVVPHMSMNPMLRRVYGEGIDKTTLEMFGTVMANCAVDRVMVQRRPGDDGSDFTDFYTSVRDTYYEYRKSA